MTNFRIGRNREGDICYRCKEQGHWSVDCPTKNPAVCTKYCPTPPPPTRFWGQENGLEYSPPLLVCRCGLPCPLRISTNPTNFNRPFYACPSEKCKNSFKWEDQARREELVHVPICGCGAGYCRQCVEESGDNAGRKYFACAIKKGQGACTFYKLIEGEVLIRNVRAEETITSPSLTLMDYVDTSPEESVLDKSFGHKRVRIGSNNVDTAHNSENRGALSGHLKSVQFMEMEGDERDTSVEPLVKHNKQLQHEAPQYYVSSITPPTECTDKTCRTISRTTSAEEELQTFLRSEVEIRLRQVEFLRQMSLEGIALSGVFPSYDPILIPQSKDKPKVKPAGLQILPKKQVSVMNSAISQGFATLARNLQNQLHSLLELTDWQNHNAMEHEARITFAAFDQLQMGCQPFRERVEKLIKCSSSLAQTEGFCIHHDLIYHELQEHYNIKKRRFDDISYDYHMAKADVETSRECLQSVRKEVSHVKDMLFQVQAELSCRVAENRYHETRFVKISKEMEKSEQACREAFEAAEEAFKHSEQRKDELNEAESAYDKAGLSFDLSCKLYNLHVSL